MREVVECGSKCDDGSPSARRLLGHAWQMGLAGQGRSSESPSGGIPSTELASQGRKDLAEDLFDVSFTEAKLLNTLDVGEFRAPFLKGYDRPRKAKPPLK